MLVYHFLLVSLVSLLLLGKAIAASPVPLNLPESDGRVGNDSKPVKVYILAGQSNMVGMGDLAGASPPFPRVFYSADPAIIAGAYRIGRDKKGRPLDTVAIEHHAIHEATATVIAGGNPVASPTPVALGTVSARLPAIADGQSIVVNAHLEVPDTGEYLIHAGFGESAHNTMLFDGKQPAGKITLESGKRYPLEITYAKSGSCAFWMQRVDIPGQGDLTILTRQEKKFPHLIDETGQWTQREDVTYIDPRLFPERPASPLSATSNNGKSIGSELGLGWVLGTYHDEQVLLIKTAMGNRSLRFDFQPPSSGRKHPDSPYEGFEYRAMIQGVRDTLANIGQVIPGYRNQGYEIAGFAWFQGHKDSGSPKEEYEQHLVNLINDLRKEFNTPALPAVIATVGFQGYRISTTPWLPIWEAQMAVGDPRQHPEFAGNVASVDTRDFWREIEESPRNQDYHYHRNPETYLLIGEAMGRAMVRLLGGQAEEIPKSGREQQVTAALAAETTAPAPVAPTESQKIAHLAAIRPIILDSALADFLANPKIQPALQRALNPTASRLGLFLNDIIDDAVDFYRAAGVHDYSWKPFGRDPSTATWDYFEVDFPSSSEPSPAATDSKPQSPANQQIILPPGMENWFAPEFDPRENGWKSGPAPFGESAEQVVLPEWAAFFKELRVPETITSHDVLLLRQRIEVPPFKEGHRYRIRLTGSAHNNMGEPFTLYADGVKIVEIRQGLKNWRRQARLPRGITITPDLYHYFEDGAILLAAANQRLENPTARGFMPPGLALSITIEEQKLPPIQQSR